MQRVYGQITGWGAYTPQQLLTNHDLTKLVETNDEWIVQRSGIRERRIAATDETTCTMSVAASRDALQRAGLSAQGLDLIIVATSTPDHHTPPVSSSRNRWAWDIRRATRPLPSRNGCIHSRR